MRRWARAMARGRSIFGCDYILDLTIETQVSSRPRVTSQLIAQPSRHQHLPPPPGSRRSPPCPGSGSADRPFHRRRRAAPSPACSASPASTPVPLSLASSPRTRCGSARSPRPRARASSGRVPPRGDGVRVLFDFRFKNYSRRQCHSDQSFILPMCTLTTVH